MLKYSTRNGNEPIPNLHDIARSDRIGFNMKT